MSAAAPERRRRPRRARARGSRACAAATSSASSITLATLALAVVWAFPLYWALVTTFKPEYEIVQPGLQLWPEHFTLRELRPRAAAHQDRHLVRQFADHLGRGDDHRRRHGGRRRLRDLAAPLSRPARLFWWMILASFMVPIPALIVNHFILMSQFH